MKNTILEKLNTIINELDSETLSATNRTVLTSDMEASLEEFYECAGFADFYERILKPMTNKEIIEYWFNTFGDDENIMTEEMNYWGLAF